MWVFRNIFRSINCFFLRGFLLPFSDLPLSVTNAFFIFSQSDTELLIFLFFCSVFLFAMIDWLLIFFFHVRSSTHSQPSVSILTFCACVCSRRRASINSLAQKKAAQRRDAKLTQLLAQNDEVRDADFILLPAFKRGVRGSQIRGRREGGMEGCVCERYFRGGCCWWWDGGSLDGWEGAN